MDENKEVNTTDPKREKVRVIPLSAIDDAPDHPFGVRDDEEMAELVESISTFGVINPVIVRKGEGERYELISGHRRKYACAKLGIDTLPVIVRDLSREEAIVFMVDSNLQREHILPSERAKAYKMKMEALKRVPGKRYDEKGAPLVPLSDGLKTRDIVGAENGESREQVRRYIRLNNLIPELLEDVDIGIIVLACIIYSKFATTMPSVNASASAISQVWSYIGEILFNMLVLVGTIKLSDQVVNKMMGV